MAAPALERTASLDSVRARAERRLALAARDGDEAAFREIYDAYRDRIWTFILYSVGDPCQAQDILQTVFLKAFRGLGGFRREARFSTWLYGIMLNSVRTYWRTRKRRNVRILTIEGGPDDDDPAPDLPAHQDDPLGESVRAETVEIVRRAIHNLDEDLREMVVLRDVEGLTYEQMAQVLGLPLGTVKSRLFRARGALKDSIAPLFTEQPQCP